MKSKKKSLIRLALLPLVALGAMNSQTPSATKSDQVTQAEVSTSGNDAKPAVFRSQARLVLIPALVTDRSGHHIPGLNSSDFVVKDNGKVHAVKLVEEIAAPPSEILERAKLPAGTYSNDRLRPKAPLRIVIILFDMLNSHFKDQVPARIQVTKYLNEQVEPGTMVALLGLGRGGLRMYHDLTSDTKGLATELQQSMETGRHSISTNLKGELSETEAEEAFVGHGGFSRTGSSGRSSKKLIVLDTLAAFRNIAGAYSSLPGRKSLVWVTGGFPFTLNDSKAGSKGMAGADQDNLVDMLPEYEATWQALNDANVALYPVDMHGLQNTAPDATYRAKRGGNQVNALGKFATEKQDRNADNIQSLTSFAGETGGKAFYNNNDLVAGFKEAVADSRSSYLLGYYLEQDATPGWHKLQVNVRHPGVHIRARAGYLVAKPNGAEEQAPTGSPKLDTEQANDVNLAMKSPMNYTGVPITVKWLDPIEAKTQSGSSASGTKRTVPFQIILPPDAVALEENRLSLKIVGLARASDGQDAADFVKRLEGNMKPDVAKRLALAGVKFDSMISLAPGYYNVRFVVRDNISGRLGSVTAPLVVKD
jgi:VWFA-related protein